MLFLFYIIASTLIGVLGGFLVTQFFCSVVDPSGTNWCGLVFVFFAPLVTLVIFVIFWFFVRKVISKPKSNLIIPAKLQLVLLGGTLIGLLVIARINREGFFGFLILYAFTFIVATCIAWFASRMFVRARKYRIILFVMLWILMFYVFFFSQFLKQLLELIILG